MLFYRSQKYVPKAQNGKVVSLPGTTPEERRNNPDNYDWRGRYLGDDYVKPRQGLGAVGLVGAGAFNGIKALFRGATNYANTAKLYRGAVKVSQGAKKAGAIQRADKIARHKAISKELGPALGIGNYSKYAITGTVGVGLLGFVGKIYDDIVRRDNADEYQSIAAVSVENPIAQPKIINAPAIAPNVVSGAQPELEVAPIESPKVTSVDTVSPAAPAIDTIEGSGATFNQPTVRANPKETDSINKINRIKAIQRGYGINDDGIWGNNTQKAYNAVKAEQVALTVGGYYEGVHKDSRSEIDGIVGNKTKLAREARTKWETRKKEDDKALEMYDKYQTLEAERKNSSYKVGGEAYKKGGILYNT